MVLDVTTPAASTTARMPTPSTGRTGVRYLLVLAGVGITLVLVGIVALVLGLSVPEPGLSPPWPGRGALLNQTRDGIADCLSRSLYVRLGGLTITRQRIRRSDCRIKHGQRFISPLCAYRRQQRHPAERSARSPRTEPTSTSFFAACFSWVAASTTAASVASSALYTCCAESNTAAYSAHEVSVYLEASSALGESASACLSSVLSIGVGSGRSAYCR